MICLIRCGSASFTTLYLASGYWQIKKYPASQEKTAFITIQRVVMPLARALQCSSQLLAVEAALTDGIEFSRGTSPCVGVLR